MRQSKPTQVRNFDRHNHSTSSLKLPHRVQARGVHIGRAVVEVLPKHAKSHTSKVVSLCETSKVRRRAPRLAPTVVHVLEMLVVALWRLERHGRKCYAGVSGRRGDWTCLDHRDAAAGRVVNAPVARGETDNTTQTRWYTDASTAVKPNGNRNEAECDGDSRAARRPTRVVTVRETGVVAGGTVRVERTLVPGKRGTHSCRVGVSLRRVGEVTMLANVSVE